MRFLAIALVLAAARADAAGLPKLNEQQAAAAAADYQQYCALCHGEDRQGHANDHAPSLKSQSLFEAGLMMRYMATAYGRPGTAMAGFSDEIGGPMPDAQIRRLMVWLQEESGVELGQLPREPVSGDADLGARLYVRECAECHGDDGEGGIGTALGNQAMLSMTPDPFIRHAIRNGRQGTEMKAFADSLSAAEIDALTAFIRSRASGWDLEKPVLRKPPSADEYVLNPEGEAPQWTLRNGRYVMAADLYQAIAERRRMVLLDTRNMSSWQMAHIEGSVPLPYYQKNIAELARDLPRDGTWIVTYCECPRAAAEHVNRNLVVLGFESTAVLWEGAFGWIGLGYPVSRGETIPLH